MKAECLCGAVKLTAPDVSEVGACHCGMCRRWGGGPFLALHCGTEVKFEGQQKVKTYPSSEWAERAFCADCGTHLYYRLKATGEYFVPAGLFAEIRIPSTFSSDGQIPWGSSAFSDPEFSDERLAIIHDTCAATRTDKIEFLAQQPLALQYLRVCPGVKNDANYNCCRCEKCLRTMVSLYACGALERAAAFPLPLTPELVSRTLVLTDAVKAFTDENIRLLQRYRPENDEMLRALRIQRDRPLWLARLLAKTSRKRRHLRSNLRRILDRAVGLRRRDGPAG